MTRLASALACALALSMVAAPGAGAFVFWSNKYEDAIGRANEDASGIDQGLVHGLRPQSNPVGVAARGAHVYWANFEAGDSIGRANLHGSCVERDFIPGAKDPVGVAADSAHVYWTNAGSGTIGRANLDGSGANHAFVTGLHSPYGLAVNATHLYWTEVNDGTISRAGLDVTDPVMIATANLPTALALDSNHLYWAATGGIGRSNLDGSVPEPGFITATGNPWGVAVDAAHVYWTDQGSAKRVGRADLDAGNPEPGFLPAASGRGVYGIAVAPAAAPEPCPVPGSATLAPAAARDTTSPALRRLALSRSRFAAARRGASISRVGVGTELRFALSEDAVVRFRVARPGAGRLVKGRCRPRTRANRVRRRCDRVLKGSFGQRGRAGSNRARFSGRLRRRALRPGRYRLEATATDAAGNRSRRATVRFVIKRR